MSPYDHGRSESTICFLLLNDVHLIDLAGPAQVFYEASQFGPCTYNLQYCGVGEEAYSKQGLMMAKLKDFKDVKLQPGDFVVIPGTDFNSFVQGKLKADVHTVRSWLQAQSRNGVQIASICSGALILAEVGLLKGKKCTTHWKCIDFMVENYPDITVQTDRLFVKDQNIYTSAGMTSGIDMSLSILEQRSGPILAAKVAREIVVYLRRGEVNSQESIYLDYKTHFNPIIHKIQDYIISHADKNPSLEELAALGNTSVRNLTRMFRNATGHSIIQFKNALKTELAKSFMHNSSYTQQKIASLCGFQSARHLRRVIKKK